MPDPSSDSSSLFGVEGDLPHEQVLLSSDPASGLRCIVAIHSTVRGPAFGGCRLWAYPSDHHALTDALRLSQGMSLKNALADLPFGGGKAVILRPAAEFRREALFTAFGKAVAAANGRYITAEDVGSSTSDMHCVRRNTTFVSGLPRDGAFGGDPSPKTAFGVYVAIEQGLQRHLQRPLKGALVAVQGLGAVGMSLCERLHDAGAQLVVADINVLRTQEAVAKFGARVVSVDQILAEPCDALAPCALGAVLNHNSIPNVQAPVICGAANNQLATPQDGDALHARGVLYLPDFLVNAGGIVSVAREYLGQGEEDTVMREVGNIGRRVAELLERAGNRAPSREADAWAREKMVALA